MSPSTATFPLIPRRALFGHPAVDAPRIAPDATRLVYLAPHLGTQCVWVRDLGQRPANDRVVAHDRTRPVSWARWQGDGRHVLYLQDDGGNENYHLFQVEVDGVGFRDLTPGDGVRAMPLAIDPCTPGELLVTLNRRDPRLLDVHRVNVTDGESVLDTINPGDVVTWLADTRLVVRAAVAQLPDGSYVIRVRDDADAPWRTLDEVPFADGQPRIAAFSPDGRSLYAITAKEANASRLVRYDVCTGRRVVVFEHPIYDVERVFVDPSSHNVVAVAVLEERLVWTALDPAFARHLDDLRAADPGDFLIDGASADGNTLIIRYQSDVSPDSFHCYDKTTGKSTLLFHSRPDLRAEALAPMRPIAYEARDGLVIHGYLTLPNGTEPHDLPMVVYVHGGPWYRDRWGYEPIVQWLANRGYAVLQVNFRGSTGYGKAFLNAGNREWAGAMRTDLLDARDWAIAQGVADPKRIAIFGGSFGGYAVLTALAWTPDAFACGVDIVGPSNLETFMATLPPYWSAMRKLFTERVGEAPEFLRSQSPLHRASFIRAPLLIAQGANDPRVKRAESDQIVEALRESDVAVEYLLFENEGHGFADPDNLERLTALAETFLAHSLGGRVEHA
ncbi:MAG TPA: S9 family peptidase [Gemmatimonadaceae bacterium]|nr:S9 family peptidase [Gemmatimonadaceae bacterium]